MRNRTIIAGAAVAAFTAFLAPRRAVSQATAPLAPDTSWVRRSALYEVFVKDFSPQGNLRGVTRGLDRIVASGATVIWLMPLQPAGVLNHKGTYGSPYAIRDYMAIDRAYGTRADLRALVRAAHARGLKVILDWVPDHTAWDAVWVRQHPDFYVRGDSGQLVVPRDPQGHPTDWTDVVQLDYTKPALRAAMTEAMRRWLVDYDLDGFREDVAHFIPLDYWAECITTLRHSVRRPIMMLAEAGELSMHRAGFDLTYSWDSYSRLKQVWRGAMAARFAAGEVPDMDSMPAGGMRMRFTTNHDETAWDNPPVILFGGSDGARAAYVAAALLPGRPLLYNGQEVESPQKLRLFERDTIDWNQPHADSTRAFYHRVLLIARTDTLFTRGTFAPLVTTSDSAVIAYRRGAEAGGAIVLVNARNTPVTFTITGASPAGLVNQLSGRPQAGDTVSLAAYGAAVLERPHQARVRIKAY